MNCRKRMSAAGSSSKQVHKPKPREGNAVTEGDGKTGMEYKPVIRSPGWDGKGKVVADQA